MNRKTATTIDLTGVSFGDRHMTKARTSRKRAVAGAATLVVLAAAGGAAWHLTGAGASTTAQNTHGTSAGGPSLVLRVEGTLNQVSSRVVSTAARPVQRHATPTPAKAKPTAPAKTQSTPPPATTQSTPPPAKTQSTPAPSVDLVTKYTPDGSIEIPRSWVPVVCGTTGAAAYCGSFKAPAEVWYNPANPGERVTFNACWGKECPGQPNVLHATLKPLFPVTSEVQLSFDELAFHIDSAPQFGTYPVDGVVSVAHMGLELAYPMVTVTASIPSSDHSTATAILDSVKVYPPESCGG
jgi:hypothetical protein